MRLSSKFFHFCLIFTYIQANKGDEEDKCTPSASACPSGWERMEDQCYLWPGFTNSTGSTGSTRKSWANAELFCKDQDGHLAAVTNQRIHDYMKTKVNADDFDAFFWVGGADRELVSFTNPLAAGSGSRWNEPLKKCFLPRFGHSPPPVSSFTEIQNFLN